MATKKLPPRSKVKVDDTWDLSSLFETPEGWQQALDKYRKQYKGYEKFRGTLDEGPQQVAKLFDFDVKLDRLAERIGTYAYLRLSEDSASGEAQRMVGLYQNVMTQAAEVASFIRPELLALPATKLNKYLADKQLAPYRLKLERMVRYKPHTLGQGEERLLAMQGEMAGAAQQAFRQLTDADMKFGDIENEKGQKVELGHSSFSAFLNSPDRKVRKTAFHQFYGQFQGHVNTLAATLNGSVQRDVYYARARNYPSAREASLFADNVPTSVYDSLIAAVHNKLPALYRYFEIRRRRMKLKDIHHYDTYVPILSELDVKHTWNQAVKVVVDSLAPLGSEYCSVLHEGLTTARWCDRYANQGKRSGAFSSGSFDGKPYILMNYQSDVLNHVFTLAHEAGHSMHSYYSAKTQPFQYYDYTIFVAEVASTFNEELLGKYLMDRAGDDNQRAYLVNRAIDDIRGTIIRQTMFAEFEQVTHAMAEAGEPLTVDSIKAAYRKLLDLYFGPDFVIDPELELECFRIPHFYNAFYVYKYATGMSAAIALSKRVLEGGQAELDDYLGFLKAGCSKWPLDILRDAGVDMEQPEPVETALGEFERLVDELDSLL
jgi:oligoendopeptidase F